VLKILFIPKRVEVAGGWRSLRNEEIFRVYASPSNIRVITLRMVLCSGHVACMREMIYKMDGWMDETT